MRPRLPLYQPGRTHQLSPTIRVRRAPPALSRQLTPHARPALQNGQRRGHSIIPAAPPTHQSGLSCELDSGKLALPGSLCSTYCHHRISPAYPASTNTPQGTMGRQHVPGLPARPWTELLLRTGRSIGTRIKFRGESLSYVVSYSKYLCKFWKG